MQKLLETLSTAQPGQVEMRKANQLLVQAIDKLEFGGSYEPRSLQQLSEACKSLGEICANILIAARYLFLDSLLSALSNKI